MNDDYTFSSFGFCRCCACENGGRKKNSDARKRHNKKTHTRTARRATSANIISQRAQMRRVRDTLTERARGRDFACVGNIKSSPTYAAALVVMCVRSVCVCSRRWESVWNAVAAATSSNSKRALAVSRALAVLLSASAQHTLKTAMARGGLEVGGCGCVFAFSFVYTRDDDISSSC